MFCYKCGNQLPDDAEFCNKCGAKLFKSSAEEQSSGENKSTINPDITEAEVTLAAKKENEKENESENPTRKSAASTDAYNDKIASDDTYRFDRLSLQNAPQNTTEAVRETAQFKDDQNSFIQFIDSRIRANTQYNSAPELLNSKPRAKFAWLSYGISAIVMLMLSIMPILNGNGIWAVLLLLALSVIPGYLAAYISGGIIARLKLLSKYTLKLKGKADKEELKSFLNNRLSYLKPYFDEWGDKKIIGFGLIGAIQAAYINAAEKSSPEAHIVSYFGSNKFLMPEIDISPDLNGDPEYTICTFSVDSRYRGFSFIASYKTMIKTAPILRAAMEYYFWQKYGEESGVQDPPHSSQDTWRIQPYSVNDMNYGADQNAYSSIKTNCASEKKRTILNSVLIGIGAIAVIAIVVLIVIIKAPSVNYVDKSTNNSNTVLSNDYTSEDGSFSLKYPSDWNKIPNPAVFVELSSSDGMANIQVIECLFAPFGVFTDSEAEIKNSVNQFHTFIDLWDTKLGDISVKALSYQTDGLKGKRTVNNYWYEVGDNLYQIICSYEKAEYEAVLESILNSYTINNTAFSFSNESDDERIVILGEEYDINEYIYEFRLEDEYVSRRDMENIAKLNIECLTLLNCEAEDYDPIRNMNIYQITLSNCNVKDLSFLKNMTNLEYLFIMDIQGICTSENMEIIGSLDLYDLTLSNTGMDSSAVYYLKGNSYGHLNLENNLIDDVSNFEYIVSSMSVQLNGNNLSNAEIEWVNEHLKTFDWREKYNVWD